MTTEAAGNSRRHGVDPCQTLPLSRSISAALTPRAMSARLGGFLVPRNGWPSSLSLAADRYFARLAVFRSTFPLTSMLGRKHASASRVARRRSRSRLRPCGGAIPIRGWPSPGEPTTFPRLPSFMAATGARFAIGSSEDWNQSTAAGRR